MAALKEAALSAAIAWSPLGGPYLAAGTAAGGIDASFSSASAVEVLVADLASPSIDLLRAGPPAPAPERFTRVAWGSIGAEGPHPEGVIAGGLADGTVALWDGASMLGGGGGGAHSNGLAPPLAPLARLAPHAGAVSALQFNAGSPNLLASGGLDGELRIWDVASPAAPSQYPALRQADGSPAGGGGGGGGGPPGGGPPGSAARPSAHHAAAAPGALTALAWNTKVPHILGSGSGGGAATVWDLKKQKAVIVLADGQGRMRRASALAWDPACATRVAVACGDDMCPAIQVWDLRRPAAPAGELLGHAKGVLALAWCEADPALLLSGGKDGRVALWDTEAGTLIGEAWPGGAGGGGGGGGGGGAVADVAWAPASPGVWAAAVIGGGGAPAAAGGAPASAPGTVTISTLAAFCPPVEAGGPGRPLARAPAWLRRPASLCAGFGGRLASVSAAARSLPCGGGHADAGAVAVQAGVLSGAGGGGGGVLASTAEAFLDAELGAGDRPALAALCAARAAAGAAGAGADGQPASPEAAAREADTAEEWGLLRSLFEADPRAALLSQLGYEDALPPREQQQQQQQQGGVPPGTPGGGGAAGGAAAAADTPAMDRRRSSADGSAAAAFGLPADDGGGDPAAPADPDGAAFFEDGGASFFEALAPLPPGAAAAAAAASPRRASDPYGRPPTAAAAATPGGASTFSPRPGSAAAAGCEDAALSPEDAAIQRALLVGNYGAAVEAALRAGRPSDALLAASLGGGDLWAATATSVGRGHPRPYTRLLAALAEGDLGALVASRPLDGWRGTLAALASYASPDAFPGLCDALARRAAAAGLGHAAACAWVCAGNVDAAVRHWGAGLGLGLERGGSGGGRAGRGGGGAPAAAPPPPPGPAADAALQAAVERSLVLGLGAGAAGGPALATLVGAYAERLAADGAPGAAARVLALLPPDAAAAAAAGRAGPGDDPAAVLRDRLYRCGEPGVPRSGPAPPFPFAGGAASAPPPPPPAAGGVGAAGGGHGAPQGAPPAAAASAFAPAAPASPATDAFYQSLAYTTSGAYGAPPPAAPAAAPPPAPPAAAFAPATAAAGYAPGAAAAAAAAGPAAPPAPPPPPAPPAAAYEPARPAYQQQAPAAFGGAAAAGAPHQQYQQQHQAPTAAPPAAAAPPAVFTPGVAGPGGMVPGGGGGAGPVPGGAAGVYVPGRVPPAVAPPAPGAGFFAPAPAAPASPFAPSFAPPPPAQQQAPPPPPPPPPPPAGPPPTITVATADVSSVPPALAGAVRALAALHERAAAAAAGAPGKKRETDDNARRLGALFWRLNAGQVTPGVASALASLGAALDAGDGGRAAALAAALAESDWDECGAWLTALKRLVKGAGR